MSRVRVRHALQRGAGRFPRAAVAAADALAWATQPLGRGVEPDAIRAFLPDAEPAEVERIRRATWSSWLRLRVVQAAVAAPAARWPYPPLVSGSGPVALRPPLVLASFHLGPIPALGILLEQLPGGVLILSGSTRLRPGITMEPTGAGQWRRAAAFRAAVDTLRAGGSVLVLVDAREPGATVGVTLFGRASRLGRGAFALARLTGCPLVPVAARWRGSRIEIVTGDPIPAGDESAMAAATAGWIERFVRESPEVLSPRFAARYRAGA